MCGQAGDLSTECWSHLLTLLPERVPPPNGPSAEAINLANTVNSAWAGVDPVAARRHVDRFWQAFFANSYAESTNPDGTALADYPPNAAPAIRAAAAMRATELGQLTGGFIDRRRQLAALLAVRSPRTQELGRAPEFRLVQVLGEPPDGIEKVSFLGPASRPLGATDDAELALCVLEAAARTRPPERTVLTEAHGDPDPIVSGEAGRPLAELDHVPPDPFRPTP